MLEEYLFYVVCHNNGIPVILENCRHSWAACFDNAQHDLVHDFNTEMMRH